MESELQFDQVQRPAGASTCSSCRSALLDSYYQVNGRVLCQRCADGVRNFFESKEGSFVRFLKAAAFGIGGGLAGGVVYTAVLALTDRRAFWEYGGLCVALAAFRWLPVPPVPQ